LREVIAKWARARLPVEDFAEGLSGRLRMVALALLISVVALGAHIWREGLTTGPAAALLLLAVLVAVMVGLGGQFLAHTFSDVYIWNSNQAHDRDHARRQEVLANARALFEHVARDPACKRMVIVAHSLGTPITLETLAAIGGVGRREI